MVLKCKKIYRPVRFRFILLVIAILFIAASGCKVTYSFSGVTISPLIKTISIQYFQNRASLVQPGLSQNLTDALIDKCKAQTGRNLTNGMGDVNFEGEISDYNTKPITVSAGERAAMNRFTISVKVKYTNSVNPELSYEKTFTRYEDYDSNLNLSNVEKELTDKITELIVEDIFNAAFVNW
jgi:membrane protein implicated in regulation of membrane protease activity